MSNFPSSTNQHAIVRPARPSLPTSAIPIPFSAPSGHRTRSSCVSCFLCFSCDYASMPPTICESEKKLAQSHFHLQNPLDWPGDLREKGKGKRNRENDLVPTRRTEQRPLVWERHGRCYQVAGVMSILSSPRPTSQNNPKHHFALTD